MRATRAVTVGSVVAVDVRVGLVVRVGVLVDVPVGPPGAGKSATGWALYDGLVRSGARAGFVDIDQLGMCFPAPPHDPELFLLKERNVSVVAANFRRIGCDAFIVSGDLGLSGAISSETVHGASVTICRLRASPDELRRRLPDGPR